MQPKTPFDIAAPWLAAALNYAKRPLWTLDDIKADLEANEARLWLGERSCVLTTVSDFHRSGERLCEAWCAGGDFSEIGPAIASIEAWARDAGCTQAHVSGRVGWQRRLAPFGYEHYSTTVRKLLRDGT